MDPLSFFLSHSGFDKKLILRIEAGTKYAGIQLRNGHIGVCSTLGSAIPEDELLFDHPDLEKRSHRILYNAYINALHNYETELEDQKDIFQHIDFSLRPRIVMVGFFRPLVSKFTEAGIPLHVFDQVEEDPILTPMEELDNFLQEAGTVILTSTSIFNGSFLRIAERTAEQSDIFLLGPSSILHPHMKSYRNVKKVYGARFKSHDGRVLDAIAAGSGTQTFMKFGLKVNI